MTPVKRFKKKYPVLHRILAFSCIVGLFWGGWRIFDSLSGTESPNYAIAGVVACIISLGILYLDDFHLKELE